MRLLASVRKAKVTMFCFVLFCFVLFCFVLPPCSECLSLCADQFSVRKAKQRDGLQRDGAVVSLLCVHTDNAEKTDH